MNKEMTRICSRMLKLMNTGKYEKAVSLANMLVKMSKTDKSIPPREKAMIRNQAGKCFLFQSDTDKAEEHFKQALVHLDGNEELSQSLDKGIYLINLAQTKHCAGQASEGDALYRLSAKIHCALMRPDAPEITSLLSSYGDDAAHDESVKDLSATIPQRAIELAEFMYGTGYPACMALEKLADRYLSQGRIDEMMSVLVTLADKYFMLFGLYNQVYGDNAIRLTRFLQDRPESTKLYPEVALTIQRRLLSPVLDKLLFSLDHLAALHEKAGETEDAELVLMELLAELEQNVPESNKLPDVLSRLAIIHADNGDFKRAVAEQKRAVDISPRTEKEPKLLTERFYQLGLILDYEGRNTNNTKAFCMAVTPYERALKMAERYFGRTDVFVAQILERLAQIRMNLKSPSIAISLYMRALSIRRKRQGSHDPVVADTLNDLALVRMGQGNYPLACKELRHALSILETVFGTKHINLVTVMNNLALALTGAGRPDKGLAMAEQVLRIREDAEGADTLALITALQNLAGLRALLGRAKEAKQDCDRAVHLAEIHYKQDSVLMKRLKQDQSDLVAGCFKKPLSAFWTQES